MTEGAQPVPAGLWPDEAAVARMLDATGRQFVPKDFSSNALRADLNRFREEIIDKQIDTAGYRKGHKEAAAEVGELARALGALVKSSGNGLFDRQLWFAFGPGEYDLTLALLSKIESKAKIIADDGIPVLETGGGAKDYLARRLWPIFQAHFGRDTRRSRSPGGGEPYGPFVRFVQAVGSEINMEISPWTIEAAVKGPNT
jgi:hypothetical protein